MDTRVGFPYTLCSVVIDSISLTQNLLNTSLKQRNNKTSMYNEFQLYKKNRQNNQLPSFYWLCTHFNFPQLSLVHLYVFLSIDPKDLIEYLPNASLMHHNKQSVNYNRFQSLLKKKKI